jgi:CHAT domain-containing protein
VAGDEPAYDDLRAARAELDEVIAEIRAVGGYENFLAAPTFDDVTAAAGDQPLVYLAAAEQGGLALIVRGQEVTSVPAGDLTEAALRVQVTRYRAAYRAFNDQRADPASAGPWRAAIEDVTGWLWKVVMGAVVAELERDTAAVLVAGGQLGLLPLHAAWTFDEARQSRRYAIDELTLTYVPNARSLAVARERARAQARKFLGVVNPGRNLAATADEMAVARNWFAPDATVLGPDTGPAEVMKELPAVDVAHFACHGFARLHAPLESGLELAGGQALTLRDIFGLRLRMRLAVLSACETSLPGDELPDEVVALPTGLLQAGVAGILASLWLVGDLPTLILMIEFYRRWREDGAEPADALRQAQRWLRDTPDEEIVTIYGAAAESGAAWLPTDAAERIIADLAFSEPGSHTYGGVESWASFGYIGA